MKKALAVAAIFSLALILVAGFSLAGCGSTQTIKIGVIAELTGSIPAVGESCRNAVTLAADDINRAGGISIAGKSYRVELVIKDSANQPEQAAAAATDLIDKDKVVAIVGPNATANTLPAAAVAEGSHVALVTPWSTSPLTTLDSAGNPRKYVFRMAVTTAYQAQHLANFSRDKLGAATAAVLFDDTADVLRIQADDIRNSFTAAGGNIAAFQGFQPPDTDVSTQVAAIKAAAPDVLFLAAYYNDVPALLRQVKGAGITAQIVGTDAWSTPDIIAQAGQDVEGAYVFNMYSPQSTGPGTQEFVAAYEAAHGDVPDDIAALSYDAVGLVRVALENSQSTERQSLDGALLGLREFTGVSGTMRWTPESRDPLRSAVMLKVVGGQFVLFAQLAPPAAPGSTK